MQISAVSNGFNVATKSQYDTYPNNNMDTMATSYPAYIEDEPKPKSNIGLIALGVIGLAGIVYGAYKHHDLKSTEKLLKDTKTALEETKTKLKEAETKVSTLETASDAANKTIEDLKNAAKKKFHINWKFWTWGRSKKA